MENKNLESENIKLRSLRNDLLKECKQKKKENKILKNEYNSLLNKYEELLKSYDEYIGIVNEYQKVLKKQDDNIESLKNANKTLLFINEKLQNKINEMENDEECCDEESFNDTVDSVIELLIYNY